MQRLGRGIIFCFLKWTTDETQEQAEKVVHCTTRRSFNFFALKPKNKLLYFQFVSPEDHLGRFFHFCRRTVKKGNLFSCDLLSDIDECSSNNDCGVHSQCKNIPGSYKCVCKKGYKRKGKFCQGKFHLLVG